MKTHEKSIAVQKGIEQLGKIKNDILIANQVCEIMVANNVNNVEELLSHLNADVDEQRTQAARMLKAIGGLKNVSTLDGRVQLKKMEITLTFNEEANKLFTDLLNDKKKYNKLVSISKVTLNTSAVFL